MAMNEASLRAWIAADEAALEVERMLRKMFTESQERGTALPPMALQKTAARLRHRANFLLANLVEETLVGASSPASSLAALEA